MPPTGAEGHTGADVPTPIVPPVVACSVSDGAARNLVSSALLAEGAEPLGVVATGLATDRSPLDSCAALIYDLQPITRTSVELVKL